MEHGRRKVSGWEVQIHPPEYMHLDEVQLLWQHLREEHTVPLPLQPVNRWKREMNEWEKAERMVIWGDTDHSGHFFVVSFPCIIPDQSLPVPLYLLTRRFSFLHSHVALLQFCFLFLWAKPRHWLKWSDRAEGSTMTLPWPLVVISGHWLGAWIVLIPSPSSYVFGP